MAIISMGRFKEYRFNKDKGELVEVMNAFHDRDMLFSIVGTKKMRTRGIGDGKTLFEVEFDESFLESLSAYLKKRNAVQFSP